MKSLFAFALTLMGTIAFSQDVITTSTGNEIQAKVIEIGTDEIKYKHFDKIDGPIYVLKKSEIFMIKYKNGNKELFTADKNKGGNKGVESKSSASIQILSRLSSDENSTINAVLAEPMNNANEGNEVELLVERTKSGSIGKAGTINLVFMSIVDNDGNKIKLTGNYFVEGKDREMVAYVVTGVGCLFFLLPGLLGLLIKGEPAIINAGTIIPNISITN